MNLNLSPEAIEAIADIQSSDYLPNLLENIEDFVFENADYASSAADAMECLQTLRTLKRLIKKIIPPED